MSYKVLRDGAGVARAFGPNEDGYSPVIPDGCSLAVEETQPAPSTKQLAAVQIQLLEAQTLLPRVTREFILGAIKAEAAKSGLDPMQLPAYVKLKTLDDQIAVLRGQL